MNKNKYRIVQELWCVKITKLNMEDGTEDKQIKYNDYVELTDEELKEKIQEYKMQGYEVETYHQKYFRKKVKSVKD